MKPRRTHNSNKVFKLPGGTEDNDLWIEVKEDEEHYIVLASTWVPTDEERERIANGENIELMVWGQGHPPVAMRLTDVPLGKKPGSQTRFIGP